MTVRIVWQVVVSFIMGIIMSALNDSTALFWFIAWMLHAFIISSIFCLIFSAYLMRNLGLGKDAKQKILWRHVAIVTGYLVCNLYLLYLIYVPIFSPDYAVTGIDVTWFTRLLQALFYSQGFILPLIRVTEPGSRMMYWRMLKNLFTCSKDVKEEKAAQVNMLFNSTLNIEFVYVVLEGIVKFSKVTFAMDQSTDADFIEM